MDVIDGLFLRDTVRLTPGRVEWVAHEIGTLLRPEERPEIGPIARLAEEKGRVAYSLSVERRRAKKTIFAESAKSEDTALDAAQGAVHGYLELLARVHASGTAIGDAVRRLLERFFPVDLKTVTNASYADEIAAANRMRSLAKGELACDVERVPGLRELIDTVEERAQDLARVIMKPKPDVPTHTEAEAAAAEAERRVVDLVIAILHRYRGDDAVAARRRSELLQPYLRQQESMRQRYRRRLPMVDVNPATGEEEEEAAGAPSTEPAPAG